MRRGPACLPGHLDSTCRVGARLNSRVSAGHLATTALGGGLVSQYCTTMARLRHIQVVCWSCGRWLSSHHGAPRIPEAARCEDGNDKDRTPVPRGQPVSTTRERVTLGMVIVPATCCLHAGEGPTLVGERRSGRERLTACHAHVAQLGHARRHMLYGTLCNAVAAAALG